ncbi:MAG TPA: alpha/beta hydrolase fold domain-containing protein [Trebonia sp.]|jgi:acetyl esterase/lipase
MSLLGTPLVASALARLAQRGPAPRVAAQNSFADLPARTETATIPTRHGDVQAVVYWPAADAAGPPPVYVNFHGGGFVIRHPEQDDPLCRYLAASAGAAVVNVDYDVAPQHRFPKPVEEAYDAVRWAAGQEHPWDGARLCVGGQSAGGALAAGAARLALEAGGPAIALQVLHYPPLDLATPGRHKRAAGEPVINVPLAEVFDAAYAPSAAAKRNRLASPAWGSNGDWIAGIAPALVITCGIDRLHDEGVVYADRLAAAGALREYLDLPGVDHGYNLTSSDHALVESTYAFISKHVIAATEA